MALVVPGAPGDELGGLQLPETNGPHHGEPVHAEIHGDHR